MFESKRQAVEAFNEMLDDCYPDVVNSFGTFTMSDVLMNCDPLQYGMAFDEWYDQTWDDHLEQKLENGEAIETDAMGEVKDKYGDWYEKIDFRDLPGHPGDALYWYYNR